MRKEYKEKKLAPSILAADFNRLGEQLAILKEQSIDVLHLDVMDGLFVPSISFGMPVIASLRKETDFFFDVHLMIQEPIRYIEAFKKAGADSLTIHVEACENVEETIKEVKAQGMQCGITLNPETPIEQIFPYLEQVDLVLIMSVHPGFGGQKFIPETLDKVRFIKQAIRERQLPTLIEVDGGVNAENAPLLFDAGADVLVAGSSVFRAPDPMEMIKKLKTTSIPSV